MSDISVREPTDESSGDMELDELGDDGTPGPGRPGRKPFWTVERVKPALVKANGMLTDAAKILSDVYDRPCARETISKLVNSNPELRDVCRDARAAIIENAFSACAAAAEAGDERAQVFLLKRLDPRFRAKAEMSRPRGASIQVEHEMVKRPGDWVLEGVDDSLLTTDDKIELNSIAQLVNTKGGFCALSLTEFARMKELQARGRRH